MIGAGAAVASAGAQAASAASSGKGGGGPSLPDTPAWERLFNRGTADVLDQERRVVEDALAQGNFLSPELYAALGYRPVYDQDGPDLAGLSQKSRALADQLNAIEAQINSVKATKGKKNKRGVAQAAGYKNVADLKRAKQDLMRQKQLADRELSDAQSLPRRVVGFEKIEGTPDPTGSRGGAFAEAFNLQNEALLRALQGKEPIDPTLKREFDEKEQQLRERLRRTLGPDYESSSAGIEALANFDRERSEAFSQYNREVIGQYSQLTESRATSLSNLTGARLEQLLYPSNAQLQRGLLLGQVASDRTAFVKSQREGRGQQFQASKARYEAEAAKDQARADAIAAIGGALGKAGAGISSAGPALESYLSPSAAPDTVQVPSDDAISRYLGR